MSSKGGASRADNNRFGMDIQENRALGIYADYWGVPETEIKEVDKQADEGDSLALLLDKGGIDKIVEITANDIFLAQRFRRPRWDNPDFTIRRNPDNFDVEYGKLRNRYERGTGYPSRYAWGHAKPESGFYKFYIVDVPRFLKLEFDGELEKVPCDKYPDKSPYDDPYAHPTRDGNPWGFYAWDWQELLDNDCVVAEWISSGLVEIGGRKINCPNCGGTITTRGGPESPDCQWCGFDGGLI